MNGLEKFRPHFGRGLIALMWVNVVLIGMAAYSVAHVPVLVAIGSAMLIALGATAT